MSVRPLQQVAPLNASTPPGAATIALKEDDSRALRDITRRLADVQTDAQLAADRAKVAIHEIVIEHQRLVRRLADEYGFDETIPHEHDAAAHTLTRQAKVAAK